MHGVKKQHGLKRSEKEQQKIDEYRDLCKRAFQMKKECIYDSSALDITRTLVLSNPDFYTQWNYRKLIISHLTLSIPSEDIQKILKDEIKFTEECLKVQPKSYCVWFHRKWCLSRMPIPSWDREILLLDKMLDVDSRNFHGWDYRRHCISSSNIQTPLQEFNYTSQKINQNFSNYSAWHLRSKVLVLAHPDVNELRNAIEKDFELVRNAIFTEPADQSAWLYQRWLLGSNTSATPVTSEISCQPAEVWEREQEYIKELVDMEPHARWALLTLIHIESQKTKKDCNQLLITQCVDTLKTIDPTRTTYYGYLSNKTLIH